MRISKLKDEKLSRSERHMAEQGCCPDCIGPLQEGPCGGGSINTSCFICGANFCFALNWTRLNDRLNDNQLFTRDLFSTILCSRLKKSSQEHIEDFAAILVFLHKEIDKNDKEEWKDVGETLKEFLFPEIIGPINTRSSK